MAIMSFVPNKNSSMISYNQVTAKIHYLTITLVF